EEGGTYRLADGGGPVEEDEDKPEIDYAPDMSIKDLRGPAQAAVVRPSNYLLIASVVGFMLDIFVILYMAWPFMFSDYILDHEKVLEREYKKKGGADAQKKIDSIPRDRKALKKEDEKTVADEEEGEIWRRVIFIILYIPMLLYNGVQAL